MGGSFESFSGDRSRPREGHRRAIFATVALLLPFAALALLEVGLRLGGFGDSHPLFIPQAHAPDYLRVNPDVVGRFMVRKQDTPNLKIRPVLFPLRKGPGTLRIFVQGGSTAEGFPYGYSASPGGMLQQRLQRTFPDRRIEVITTAMSAVNTYTLLDFSSEILRQQPDAIVIYAGHNEYVGLLGVGSHYSVGRNRPMVLTLLALKNARLLQLGQRVRSLFQPEVEPGNRVRHLMTDIVAEESIPYQSPLYDRGLDQFRANLSALLGRYRKAGIPVFVGTVASNERDQPPFVSGHAEDADIEAWQRSFDAGRQAMDAGDVESALEHFRRAVAIDDAHAHGHYALGQALDQLRLYPEARRAYIAAKDRDELRFRAPEEINHIIRSVAMDQGAHVVEVRRALAAAARDGIIGYDLMLEHLHPNIDGYFLLADAFYEAMREGELIRPWGHAIPRETAMEEMPFTEIDRLYGEHRIAALISQWPFTDRDPPFEVAPASDAIEAIHRDRQARKLNWPGAMSRLLEHYRDTGAAADAARAAVMLAELVPYSSARQQAAADLLEEIGRADYVVFQDRAARVRGRNGVNR